MKIINHSIVGSGLSSLIKDHVTKNSIIFSGNENRIIKSKRFYECLNIGGNSNIWGGYINYKKFLFLLKNKKFNYFYKKQKIFKVRKLFENQLFNNTYYLSNFDDLNILRINKKKFLNPIITKKIDRISFKGKKTFLHMGRKKILSKKTSLCLGNLSLIQLLFRSKIINLEDKVQFQDGNCSYMINFLLNPKKYYYIPLTINEIITKLISNKKKSYSKIIKNTFIVQRFNFASKKYTYTVEELMKYNSRYIRYFLSNHTANLKINNLPVNSFIHKYSKKINIYNSGIIKSYIAGPISQEIMFNSVIK